MVASGDLRLSANQVCWPAQQAAETALTRAVQELGFDVVRAHPVIPEKGHGFIDSQRYGLEIFQRIPPGAPVTVIEAVWQYSHHVLGGLIQHCGPLLTAANWSGQWPGLVGMLNLNGSLTKAGVKYDTLWSKDFTDPYFLDRLKTWLNGRRTMCDRRSSLYIAITSSKAFGHTAILSAFTPSTTKMGLCSVPGKTGVGLRFHLSIPTRSGQELNTR
jgi:hypothetical protein